MFRWPSSAGHNVCNASRFRKCAQLTQIRRRRGCIGAVCAAAAAATMRTHYDVLGVRDSASIRDIKDAFRRLALMWHPDRCKQPGAKDKFMELKAAYDTLVDMTARAKYDMQLKQASQLPPATAGPTTVGYDWSRYRTAPGGVRRSGSVRKTPEQQSGNSSSVPPRPSSRPSSGDDYDLFSRMGSATASNSTSTSTPGRTASAHPQSHQQQHPFRSGSAGGGSSGYQSIFGDAGPLAGSHGAARSSSSRSTSTSSNFAANSIFTRATTADSAAPNQSFARSTSAFNRSSSRSRSTRASSRSRYAAADSSSVAWSSRAPSPTPSQQWHSMYCHSGDDIVPATGTSHAATTALVRAGVYAAAASAGVAAAAELPSMPSTSWHSGASGDGFALHAPSGGSDDGGVRALPAPEDAAPAPPAWTSSASRLAGGDDYAANQHALVRAEKQEVVPVRPAVQWSLLPSFISIRIN